MMVMCEVGLGDRRKAVETVCSASNNHGSKPLVLTLSGSLVGEPQVSRITIIITILACIPSRALAPLPTNATTLAFPHSIVVLIDNPPWVYDDEICGCR
jgi:hypothetical protein